MTGRLGGRHLECDTLALQTADCCGEAVGTTDRRRAPHFSALRVREVEEDEKADIVDLEKLRYKGLYMSLARR